MNPQKKDIRDTEAARSLQDPIPFSSEGDGMAKLTRTGREFQAARAPRGAPRLMVAITGVALCMGLASCVAPYDTHGGGSVTVTRHGSGDRISTLPGGYRSESISGSTYYYHDGYYYRRGSGGYMVVDAPRNSRYYEDYRSRMRTAQSSRYYRGASNRHDQRYDRNQVITRLPEGYRAVNHRGKTYYQSGDRYYRRQGANYIIVSSPY